MTLTELRYIVAVARERHFGRAADACFVSQPTLSVSIKKLEGELGSQIFERGGNEVTLTPIGERVVAQAQRVLDETAKIKAIAEQGKDPLLGPLKAGVIYTIGPYLLPRIVKTLIQKFPQMPLILYENYTVKLLEQMRTGELDVAILAEPFDTTGLDIQPLYDEEFFVTVPKGHPWEGLKSVQSAELREQTMLLLGIGHCFRDHVASTARQDVLAVPGARCQRRGQLLKVSTPARARTAHLTGLEAHADSRCPSQRDTTDPARAMLSWRCIALSRKHACSRLQHACW